MEPLLSAARGLYASTPAVVRGMALIALSALCFTTMHTLIRFITAEIHPFEAAFFRNLFGMVVILPWFLRLGAERLATKRLKFHALRALLQVVAMLSFFTALSLTPLAEVSALSFTAPLFASLGAVLVLGERMRLRRWSALIVGFCGTLVIIRPGFEAVETGYLLTLFSSALWAGAMLIVKSLSRTESSVTITAYMGLFLTPLSLAPALFVWQWPSWEQLFVLAVMGALGNIGHLAMAQAFKEADLTAVLPFDFTRLIWATVLGYLVFAELPDAWTWVGGTIIFVSTTYIAFREARLKGGPTPEATAQQPPGPS